MLENAIEKFKKYASNYDMSIMEINSKYHHSFVVMDLMGELAFRLDLDKEKIEVARLIGLLHDIGRFEQFMKDHVLSDEFSDHADESVIYLFDKGHIRDFIDDDKYDEVIKTVIDYYNSIYENGFEPTFLKKSKRIEQFMNDRENAYVGKERSKLKDLCAFGKVPSEKKDEKIRKKLTIEECNSMFREAYNPSKLSVSVFGDIKKSEYMSEKEFRALVRK